MYFSEFLSHHQKDNKRIRGVLDTMKTRIEEEIPYVELQQDRILKGWGQNV